jgi:cobaltochelatase CobS
MSDKNLTTPEKGVKCELDGVYVHSVEAHLKKNHAGFSLETYRATYPEAPIESESFRLARERAQKARVATSETVNMAAAVVVPFPTASEVGSTKKSLAQVFSLDETLEATKNGKGQPVMVDVLEDHPTYGLYVPDVDDKYVFDVDNLKSVIVALALDLKLLAWGPHGTGKTTLLEQVCARTNRPCVRVQHTVSTEEAHIVGHYVVKGGQTVFEPGLLPLAMRYGLVYIADEYDFALPSVTSVYQAVMEGKPLIIKEASPEWRVVKPHKNFRFFASGNTNGGGDDTGLYQGTQIMNAANYSRFGVTIRVDYMSPALESAVIVNKTRLHKTDADRLVAIAKQVREEFSAGKLSVTISPRELINAGNLGIAFARKGSSGEIEPNLALGLKLAYTNRLNPTDRKAVDDFAQRHLG